MWYNLYIMPGKKTTIMPEKLRIGQVARLLGVTTTTLRRWDRAGIFKATPIGTRGDRQYSREQVLDALRHGLGGAE